MDRSPANALRVWDRYWRGVERRMELYRFLARIGEAMVADTDENFAAEQSPDGRPWEKLSENTLAARKSGKTKIGTVSGRLRRSIVWRVLGDAVHWGTNVMYGYWFHHGTKPHKIKPKRKKSLRFQTAGGWAFARGVNHPGTDAREFLGIGDRAEDSLKEVIGEEVWVSFSKGGNI